ncbi:MAG: hypothetical protein LBP62_01555 [Clostridiales bacterium]|nr:hypothetical protein [Clostridiales bacterium]
MRRFISHIGIDVNSPYQADVSPHPLTPSHGGELRTPHPLNPSHGGE